MNCPTCNGTGKVEVKFITLGSKNPPELFKINCSDCDGKGDVSESEVKRIIRFKKAYDNAWCKCGNPSKKSTFHPRGTSTCAKHCYTCDDCKKITQIG